MKTQSNPGNLRYSYTVFLLGEVESNEIMYFKRNHFSQNPIYKMLLTGDEASQRLNNSPIDPFYKWKHTTLPESSATDDDLLYQRPT